MTDKQRINLIKLTQGMEEKPMEVDEGLRIIANRTKEMFDAFRSVGFNDEQALLVTINFMEAMYFGECDD